MNKQKLIAAFVLCSMLTVAQAFAPAGDEKAEKPKNLQVLSKKLSMDSVRAIMKIYSRSLGTRCTHCHEVVKEGNPLQIDFASDKKPAKDIARKMMKMVEGINKKYISKIEHGKLEKVNCVTCHMGRLKPIVSTDSLPKRK